MANMEKLKEYFDEGDPDRIFILEEEIASGSFGAVYKGKHFQNNNYYAVKIITPEEDEELKDFLVEISVLKKCKHANIVGFFGAWLKADELFIAMELCDGGAVTDIFGVCDDLLTEDQIILITKETLMALEYLHEKNIIHRDIKGANILLDSHGIVKLVDFGVSAELKTKSDKRNTLIGTPYWMAPEVIANKTGHQPYDFKSDIWSIGITVIELADQNPPLHEIHPMKALMMIPMKDPPTLLHPEKWSKEMSEFIGKCLKKDPNQRLNPTELLKHPWLTNVKKGREVLVELIQKKQKLEQLDDQEKTDTDSELSDTEEEEDISFLKDEKPTTPTTTQPAPQSPKEPQSPPVEKKTLTKGTNRPTSSNNNGNNKQRPTWRTNKRVTKRDIRQHELQLVTRKLIKEQLAQTRAKQKEHLDKEDALNKKHSKDKETLIAKFDVQKQTRLKSQAREEEKLKREQELEKAKLNKEIAEKQRAHEKVAQVNTKMRQKDNQLELKKQKKDYKENLSKKQKTQKSELKEVGKKSKDEQKKLQLAQEKEIEWDQKIFDMKRERLMMEQEHQISVANILSNWNFNKDIFEKRANLEWDHFIQTQRMNIDSLRAAHNEIVDFQKQRQPQELQQLQERVNMQNTHLQASQLLEGTQQKQLQGVEQRASRQALSKKHKKQLNDLKNKWKNNLKENPKDKAEIKKKEQDEKDKLEGEFKKEFDDLETKIKANQEEEQILISEVHHQKTEQLRKENEEHMHQLIADHEEERKIREENKKQLQELYDKQKVEQTELFKKQGESFDLAVQEFIKEYKEVVLAFQRSQTTLYERQQEEQRQLKLKHESDPTVLKSGHDEELKKLLQEQQEEARRVEEMGNDEIDKAKKKFVSEQKALESEHTKEITAFFDGPPALKRNYTSRSHSRSQSTGTNRALKPTKEPSSPKSN